MYNSQKRPVYRAAARLKIIHVELYTHVKSINTLNMEQFIRKYLDTQMRDKNYEI